MTHYYATWYSPFVRKQFPISYRHEHAPGFVFIAGGVGITPIMDMLRTLADRDDQRLLLLIYANREWDGATLREEIEALEARLNLRVVHVLEQPPENWTGERGLVSMDNLKRHLPSPQERYEHFICGPEPMMNAIEKALRQLGVAGGDFDSPSDLTWFSSTGGAAYAPKVFDLASGGDRHPYRPSVCTGCPLGKRDRPIVHRGKA